MLHFCRFFIVASFCAAAFASAEPALNATRITTDNAAQLVMSGPKAAGGIGDWFVGNGTLCAIVSDASHESELSSAGGALIDLGFCGRADEQFVLLQDLLNADRATPFNIDRIEATNTEATATISVFGSLAGLSYRKDFSLNKLQLDTLDMQTSIQRKTDGESIMLSGSVVLVTKTLAQYDLSLDQAIPSRGFDHQEGEEGLFSVMTEVNASDWLILLGEHSPSTGIAYGLHHLQAELIEADGSRQTLPHFYRAGVNAGASVTFSSPFWFGDGRELGYLDLLQSAIADLSIGSEIRITEQIKVAPAATVSAITDQLWAGQAEVSGQMDWPLGAVHILDQTGVAVSQTTADSDGRFNLRLSPGDYIARIHFPGKAPIDTAFKVGNTALSLPLISVGPFARLSLPSNQVMRLTLLAEPDTLPVDLDNIGLGYQVIQADGKTWPGMRVRDVFLADSTDDPVELLLPAGKYRIIASRGPEFSATETRISLAANEQHSLEIASPVRLTSTAGMLAADLHVHSAASFDTALSVPDRIRSYLAQGGEILVSTEHETIYDFSADIAALGLADQLKTVTGTEITTEVPTSEVPYTSGHGNVFPLRPQVLAPARGAPANEGLRWREIISKIRTEAGALPILQLNHARPIPDYGPGIDNQAFFTHMGVAGVAYDRYQPLHEAPNAVLVEALPDSGLRDIDFDAIEVLNTSMANTPAENLGAYFALRDDWFSLLRQGKRMTGTANSDSHSNDRFDIVLGGRNMIIVEDDNLASFNEVGFIDAIRHGRSYGSTGPLFSVDFAGSGPGDTAATGTGNLSVAAIPSPWWDELDVRVYINGELAHRGRLAGDQSNYTVPLQLAADAFVVVELLGPANALFADVIPNLQPLAFSNPIYIDANGDRQWQAPGTPLPLPASSAP